MIRQNSGWILGICLMLSLTSYSQADGNNIKQLRAKLMAALNSSSLTDSLYDQLKAVKQKTPLLICYMGSLEALKAKHSWNPYNKLKYLDNAEDTFEKAVNADPHNIEIRFMRFSVEYYVPGFLGYNKHLDKDQEEMIKGVTDKTYSPEDKDLVVGIIKFLLDSKRCTLQESANLTKQLNALT